MVSNAEIIRLFRLFAELLELHGKQEKLSHALSGAAYRLRNVDDPLAGMTKEELGTNLQTSLRGYVSELNKNGSIAELEELIQLTPSGLFDMMRIKGLGGKKLAVLWNTAKIDTIEALLEACKTDALCDIPGFGAKTQANIINSIENLNASQDRFHYADVADAADELVTAMQEVLKTKLVSLSGEVRRQTLTVQSIEIVTAVTSKKLAAAKLRRYMHISSSGAHETTGHTIDEIPVKIYHTTAKDYYRQLFIRTGTDKHVQKVSIKIKGFNAYSSEEAIYKAAGFPFIVPELREDVAEWKFVKQKNKPVEPHDIKGVVHNHTTYSDGVDKLENFVRACIKKGYEYTVISDHSKNAHYAGGLKPDKVLRQMEEIDALNKTIAPFKIFKSIECDILVSGDLDYDTSLLKKFDLVIASVHQLLKMNEERATARLIKAIENPFTTILGHMTGRQLLIRPGYPVDFKKVIDACAANQVVIELNTNPYRLDIDWSHIPYALAKGVMISLNPDAHSIGEIDNIRWGVSAGRKGGLTKEMTWNAMGLKEVTKWLKEHKKK